MRGRHVAGPVAAGVGQLRRARKVEGFERAGDRWKGGCWGPKMGDRHFVAGRGLF
jgi:hypothetical protein